MSPADILVLAAIGVMAFFAIRSIRKNGGCSSACRDCPNREGCGRRKDGE